MAAATTALPASAQRRPPTSGTAATPVAPPRSAACENLPTLPEANAPTAQSTATTGETPSATATSTADISQRFLRCALDEFGHQQYRDAIRHFELAHRAAPSADLLYNIARSHELLNEYVEAADSYEHYLRDKVNAPDRTELEGHIRELRDLDRRRREAATRQNAPTLLRITVNQPGAALRLDDRDLGVSPVTRPIEVATGMHTLTVQAPGSQLWRGEIRARQGETATATVTLLSSTAFRTRAPSHVLSYIIGGVGLATLGASLGLGVYGGTRCIGMAPPPAGSMEAINCETRNVIPVPDQITSTDCTMYPSALSCERERYTSLSTITGAVGVAVLTSAVIAYFVESGSGQTEQVTPTASDRASAVAAAGNSSP